LDPRQRIPLAQGHQVPFSARLRREASITTMTVGLIDQPEYAEQIIARGDADFVVLGRAALYDPHWAWHAAEALGADTAYAPKYKVCHPSLRPQLFPHRKAGT
ncbi:MAG TPA: oxidoreductase, partial [Steroidobacteraceae bacterium]